MIEAKKEKSCGGVIIEDGKVLMVQQNNGVVAFPKGHVEEGETEIETATREIIEETGVETELDNTKRYELNYYIPSINVDKNVVLFIGKPVGSIEVRAQEEEISAVKWVPISEVESKFHFDEWKAVWRKIKGEL